MPAHYSGKKDKKFIQKANLKKGAFTAQAKRAGSPIHQICIES